MLILLSQERVPVNEKMRPTKEVRLERVSCVRTSVPDALADDEDVGGNPRESNSREAAGIVLAPSC